MPHSFVALISETGYELACYEHMSKIENVTMNLHSASGDLTRLDVDVLVVGCCEDGGLMGPAAAMNEPTGGLLARLLEARELTGKAAEILAVHEPPGLRAKLLVFVGLGKLPIDRGAAFRAAGAAAKYLAKRERNRVAFALADDWAQDVVETAIAGAVIGCQGQDLLRSEKKLFAFKELLWVNADQQVLERGRILGENVNLARRLVNLPPNILYPEAFAEIAKEQCADAGVEAEIWDLARLESERCGSLLAVAQGSSRPPRLVIMRYRGLADQAPLIFVGKGVTFDSGGLSIKPADGMKTMKCDMAGAATVLAAMRAIAQLRLPVHVIGMAGLVENLISGAAFKVGDVLTSRSGKTIEVLNTDAEGRLVLADVLDVALGYSPAALIDLATLTGACVVALGNYVAGMMTNCQPWCDRVSEAARNCGEAAWQLPMFSEYSEQIRSSVADLKNIGEGRYGGAITAAKFLEEFVAGKPWVHIDIAGPAFLENGRSWIDAGGSGAFVRTLVEIARGWTGSVEASSPGGSATE
jgi:leucyl aminopeptidase